MVRFSLRQLNYFVAAGECGSIRLASERIHVSQPSISTAISQIEKEFRLQLFIRHHAQGLSLTPAGRRFLREAKAILDQANHMYVVANELLDEVRGPISVGCLVTLAPMVIPELSHSFVKRFPDVRITHIEGHHEELMGLLRNAKLDVAITYDLEVPSDVDFVPLAELPPRVLVANGHPLAKRKSVRLRDFSDEPYILLDLPLSRQYFMSLFLAEGMRPTISARSPHQEVIRSMVANDNGYTLVNVRPKNEKALDGKGVVSLKLNGDYRPMILGLAMVKLDTKPRIVETFEDHCRQLIKNNNIPGMTLK